MIWRDGGAGNGRGSIIGSNGDKTLTFYWGSTAHVLHPATNDNGYWNAEIEVLAQDSRTAQRLGIKCEYDTSILTNLETTDGEDSTSAIDIRFTGLLANGSDDIDQRQLIIEQF